ncbi:HTH-type transcriptional activator Btr [Dyella sp. AD56]|nr:HTH-type transcriptional activator Btr [Dyella sp. AD56]
MQMPVTTETLVDLATMAAMLGVGALAIVLVAAMPRTRASLFLLGYFICVVLDSAVDLAWLGWGRALTVGNIRWLHTVNVPVAYLYGPLLYGYVVALTSPSRGFDRRELWHLLPFAVAMLFSLANAMAGLDTTRMGGKAFLVTYHAWVLSGLAYLVFAVRHIYRSRHVLERSVADESALRLTWLRGLTTLIAVSWIWMTVDRFATAAGRAPQGWPALMLDGMTFATLFMLAWFGLRQPVLVQDEPPKDEMAPVPVDSGVPYARSALTAAQCAEIAAELARLMEREQLYVDSHLDLQLLSQRGGWPPNYVSQALNQGRGQNFFEFVNGYRVAAAERHLADPGDGRSILEIALACGFGSKSTFNAVFKRLTGSTPREYRRVRHETRNEPAI